jgi:16S rRNA (uracil1498-N3)-methyltransferase
MPAVQEKTLNSSRRFVISSRSIRDGYASYNGPLHHHMARVLRLRSGDELVLVDETGRQYQGTVDQVSQEWIAIRIISTQAPESVDSLKITVLQGLPKGEKIDLILQKGSELGVTGFGIFKAERSVPRLEGDKLQARMERWDKIAAEAARQSERTVLPTVDWHPDAASAARSNEGTELKLLLFERGEKKPLHELLDTIDSPDKVVVAVGPEGGFTPEEAELFISSGFIPVTLGHRILRTETAALAITAILQYKFGDI